MSVQRDDERDFVTDELIQGEYERLDIQPLPKPVVDSINKALEKMYSKGTLNEKEKRKWQL